MSTQENPWRAVHDDIDTIRKDAVWQGAAVGFVLGAALATAVALLSWQFLGVNVSQQKDAVLVSATAMLAPNNRFRFGCRWHFNGPLTASATPKSANFFFNHDLA